MSVRTKSMLFHLPKIITFGLALINYLYIQAQIPVKTGATISFCVVCSWYETSNFNDVLIILAASIFLLISKRWSYLAAGVLSGFILFVGLFYIVRAVVNFGWSELWQFTLKQENLFLVWEVQIVLAGVLFGVTVFYLLQDVFRRKYLH